MKKKILFIDDKPGYGGVSTCLIALTNELYKMNYEITLIVAMKSVYENRVHANVNIEECNFSNKVEVEKMIKGLNDRGVDIVNSHADSGVQIQLLKEERKNYQLYITEHLAIFDDPNYIEPRKEYFSLAQNADKIITVSMAGRRIFQVAGVEDQKLVTVYNGVIPKLYKEKMNCRIMYAGRLTETKGIFVLLKAIESVRKKFPNVKVDIYGTGRQEKEVREYIRQNHLEENCILKGFCSCMDEAYSEHEILISPSKTESCSFTILEAMNDSCVILASDVDGTREIVFHGVTGLLHPFGNYEILANQILEIMSNNTKRKMLAQNAHYEVTHRFNQQDFVNEYTRCLIQLDN